MADPVSNDELDSLIWHALRNRDIHPTRAAELIELTGSGTRIDRRMQAMRKAAGIQDDGQFDWAYGCADCLRRIRPDPADGVIEPPPIVAIECELRIEP